MPAVWRKLAERSEPYIASKSKLLTPIPGAGPMFTSTSLQEWNTPKAHEYPGVRVSRTIDPMRWQHVADDLYAQRGNTEGSLFKKLIDLRAPEVDAVISETASKASRLLPTELAELVSADCEALVEIVRELIPQAAQLLVKLELFGESVCSRWHQDNYVSRCIVSYNMTGTEYTAHPNVNFWEMEHCGNNDHIIRDKAKIMSCNVGDYMMIKGMKYPAKVNGLVHKSPETQYDENRKVQNRILLKVDIQDMVQVEVANKCDGD